MANHPPNGPTPAFTPEMWLGLKKTQMWNDWGEPGHLHNLLDDFAEQIVELKRSSVPIERLRALVALLFPDEMTPTATRQLLGLCDEIEGTPDA